MSKIINNSENQTQMPKTPSGLTKTQCKELSVSAFGNVLVWYDYALFMPFLPVLSQRFFPIPNPALRDFITFFVLSMGLFTRPVGSLIFGPIGDRIGREKSISLAILLMAIPTVLMGMIPSCDQIGLLAPVLLLIMRTLQGISMGGEYTAAMVHLVEMAPSNKRGFFGCLTDVGNQLGVLMAGGTVILLHIIFSADDTYQYAWRFPFLMGALLIPFAFMHRNKKVGAAKSNPKDDGKSAKPKFSFSDTISALAAHKTEILCTITITAFSAVAFYTLYSFIPYYFVNNGLISLKDSATCNVISTTFMIFAILLSGFLCDRFPRKIFLQIGMVCVAIATCTIFISGVKSTAFWYLLNTIYGVSLGLYYGSRAAFFAESFPKEIRCTGVSFSLSIAQAIFGGGISMVLNYCISISNLAAIVPIIVVTVCALFATERVKRRKC